MVRCKKLKSLPWNSPELPTRFPINSPIETITTGATARIAPAVAPAPGLTGRCRGGCPSRRTGGWWGRCRRKWRKTGDIHQEKAGGWKISRKSWGFNHRFKQQELGFDHWMNGGLWWDLARQFQRHPVDVPFNYGDEALGMFRPNFLDIAIVHKSRSLNHIDYLYVSIGENITVYRSGLQSTIPDFNNWWHLQAPKQTTPRSQRSQTGSRFGSTGCRIKPWSRHFWGKHSML